MMLPYTENHFDNIIFFMMKVKKYTVSRDDSIYEAWPDVVRADSGKLVCVFSECDQHASDRAYTRIMMSVSLDSGSTWLDKVPLTEGTEGKGYFYNCPRISKLSDGRLVVVIDKIDRRAGEHGFESTENFLLFSNNEGRSWSTPVITPAKGIVPDKLCELDNGRWILSCHHKPDERLIQRLWYSDNRGESWSDAITCGQNSELNLCEASILPIRSKPGVLVAFLRENSFQGKDCYKTISYDNGLTWSDPIAFPLPGCHRPVAGYLKDGQIFITYRFLQGGKAGPGNRMQNFFGALTDERSVLALSRDKARTRIFPIDYDPSEKSDLGYSGWVQFDNEEIYIVNYIVDDAPKAQIRGYLLQLYTKEEKTTSKLVNAAQVGSYLPNLSKGAIL